MIPNEVSPIVFLGGLDDALLGSSLSAEGCHEGVVLAAQDHYVRARLLKVVDERVNVELLRTGFHVLLTP